VSTGGAVLADRLRPSAAWTASDARRLILVAAAALVLFTYGLGAGSLWDQDEPRYAHVAREILRTGDLFTLRLEGRPWFVHPPLFMWLQALTGSLLGFSEFTVRMWSAISGAGVVAATFLIARLLYGSHTGVLAAAVTATAFQVLVQARLAVFDPTLLAFMLLGLYMYLVGYTGGSRRAYLWAGLWLGLATATKGPIGLLLPAMLVVVLWTVRREWWRWREIPWTGALIYLAVGLPWYVVETARHGQEFLRTAVGYYLFNRFFGVVENQPGPWWYYAPVLLLGTFPWSAFVPSALALLLRSRRDLASQVILLWCGITVAFYSAAGTKLPNYVLPVYPMLGIAVARLWGEILGPGASEVRPLARWPARLIPVLSGLFAVAVLVYGRIAFPTQLQSLRAPVVAVLLVLAGGPLIAWGLVLAHRMQAAFAALVLAGAVTVPLLVHNTMPAVEQHRPIPSIGRMLGEQMRPEETLAAVRMSMAASLMYYSDRRVAWVDGPPALEQVLCSPGRVFLVVPSAEDDAWVSAMLPPGRLLLSQDGGYRVYVTTRPAGCNR
jgi:4-amino-4-deoxy-L-arabinose transferase-like glycosyltransferase